MDVFGRSGISPGKWLKGQHGKGEAYDRTIAFRKAGGRGVVVTGDKELDARLRALEPKLHSKLVKQALRKGGKKILGAFRRIVQEEAYDTGAYMRSTSVRAKKKRKGQFGVVLHVNKEKLLKIRAQKSGKAAEFYYPAVIEFGSPTQEPKRPQRRALYDNADVIKADFISDLRELVSQA